MVSLGAVAVTGGEGEPYTIGETFYAEIRPTAPRFDARAMAVNGLDFERLKAEGQDLRSVLVSLADWVASHTVSGSSPVFVGHNAPFDWSFVNHAYHAHEVANPFGYKALDTKALAVGVLGVHWFDANKELLAERLDLPVVETEKVHRADYDAWYQAHILVRLLEHH
jgi:DNA polymerase III epsilon subunit-like protein